MTVERVLITDRESWLEERRHSLGGSDIGAVLGMNKWRSAYAVWAEKTGRLPEQAENEAMRQGRDLEGYVAQRFEERSGKRVQRVGYLLRNRAAPYLHATIDRRVTGERAGLECKTASAFNTRAYEGGVFPESYYAQCVAYLAVTGWDRWYLAALVLNKAFHVYQITTLENDPAPEWCESSVYVSPAELEALKGCAAGFWERHVLADEPPPPDGSPATGETLRAIYPRDDGGSVALFGREGMAREYFQLQEEKAALERRMEAIKQTIQEDMGDASQAFCGGYSATWICQTRTSFDWRAFAADHPKINLTPYERHTESRVFRWKKEET